MIPVLFVHCAGLQGPEQGSQNLVAYLQGELGEEYKFSLPKLANPEDPTYEEWRRKLDEECEALGGKKVILIGHSFGASVLLKYVTEHDPKVSIEGLFLLASPYWSADEDWDHASYQLQKNYQERLSNVRKMYLYHSNQDPVVPYAHFERYVQEIPFACGRTLDGRSHYFKNGLQIVVDDINQVNASLSNRQA